MTITIPDWLLYVGGTLAALWLGKVLLIYLGAVWFARQASGRWKLLP